MTYVITQKCIGTCDTACVEVCPCDCILGPVPLEQLRQTPANERGSRFSGIQMFVDPDECIDCGACEPECPVDAIYRDDDVPDEHRADIARNAAFFQRRRDGRR
jgi:ferredoxin